MSRAGSDGRVLLVNRTLYGHGPRATRTEWLERELRRRGVAGRTPEVVRWPLPLASGPDSTRSFASSPIRSLARRGLANLMIDPLEPAMRMQVRDLDLDRVGAGLLVSFAASPAYLAALHLQKAGIPYVVDQGDPWGIGKDPGLVNGPFDRRRGRAERKMWAGASGAVLTTEGQAEAVREVAPDIPVLVRPNGHRPIDPIRFPVLFGRRKMPSDELRLVHFGSLSPARGDVGVVLRNLAEPRIWNRITFTQFGGDWSLLPDDLPSSVEAEARRPVEWSEALEISTDFDAAVVLGWTEAHRNLLPSKTIEYLGLPIPRIAFCGSRESELFRASSDRDGFLPVLVGDPAMPELIERHLNRNWTEADLIPDGADSWENISGRLVEFFVGCVGLSEPASTPRSPASGGTVR